ncbi:hypothetical protein Hanom_Chr09g00840731 [Helianthus anomalus]
MENEFEFPWSYEVVPSIYSHRLDSCEMIGCVLYYCVARYQHLPHGWTPFLCQSFQLSVLLHTTKHTLSLLNILYKPNNQKFLCSI